MESLALFAVIYFLIQATIFWGLGRTNLRSRLKFAAALVAIFLLPSAMYLDGLYREFGDGGAANTVMSLFGVMGGFLNAFVVFLFRSISHESAS
jgi:ABC-type glycerol-3-phosphate transport system permease component